MTLSEPPATDESFPRDPSESGRQPETAPKLALGALLSFYRRRSDSKTQEDTAKISGLSPSALAMYESGKRLPSKEALQRICTSINLTTFQHQQLQTIATNLRDIPKIGEQWFVADDVLEGTPIFLRSLSREAEFQIQARISEMWIVTSRPLARSGDMYDSLKTRLLNEDTKFVYFLNNSSGEVPFQAMWSRLCAEAPVLEKSLPDRLRCVLSPPSLCLFHFAICNPGDHSAMFGRMIMYSSGNPIGFISGDSQQISQAYHLLEPVYQLCRNRPGDSVKTEYGEFRLLIPSTSP
jgi:transcriptional regulator with XRE-family HTH domain